MLAGASSSRFKSDRDGAIIILTAVLMVFLLGVIALAVDIGFVASTRTELQAAADSGAYAGAGALVNGSSSAISEATTFYTLNKAGGGSLAANTANIEVGTWNDVTRVFTAGAAGQPNAVRVTSNISNKPLFFGNVFGKSSFNMNAQAVATYLPRDIVVVLDFSRSMCFDSAFDNIGVLSQATIEANMQKIWQDLGSPAYGTLTFAPKQYGSSNQATSKAMKKFKLNTTPYPYPAGSWDGYVQFVQSNSQNASAGYQNKYGILNLIQYWQTYCSRAVDTPGFHVTSQQPLTAVKDAVDVFLSYLTAHSTDDRVGLSIYSASDNTALLEKPMTKTYSQISSIVRARQAGHYTGGTNISAGMNKGPIGIAEQRPHRCEEDDDLDDRRRGDAADGEFNERQECLHHGGESGGRRQDSDHHNYRRRRCRHGLNAADRQHHGWRLLSGPRRANRRGRQIAARSRLRTSGGRSAVKTRAVAKHCSA